MLKLSFVIPSHNCVTWLPHAVKTALEQTYKNIEVVIVDDGSSDRTAQYLQFLEGQGDPRIRIVRNEKPMGRSNARNKGNLAASGDVILVLDADDLATPNRAALTAQKFQSGKLDFLYGSASIIDAIGRKMGEVRADVFNKDRAFSEKQNRIVHSTVAYTREISERFQYEDGEVSRLGIDDWHQQIRVAFAGMKMDYIPQLVGCYRVLDSSVSRTRDEKEVLAFKDKAIGELKAMCKFPVGATA